MVDTSNILSVYSYIPSQNYKATNFKLFFVQEFNIRTTDYILFNKWVIYSFNQYIALNTKDFDLWTCIQIDFEKFETKYCDELDSITENLIQNYYNLYRYSIDYNINVQST